MTRFQPLPLSSIKLTDRFWTHWQKVIAGAGLQAQYEQLEQTGRLENLRIAARRERGGFEGRYFNDSDVYKWLEAAAYAQAAHPSDLLKKQIDEIVSLICEAQMDDGYIDSYVQTMHPDVRFRNLGSLHEMYCMGHLIEAAVALAESVADERLIPVARKIGDMLADTFGPGKRLGYCGHQEIELALMRLAGLTGEKKYFDLGAWMIEARGSRPSPFETETADKDAMALSPNATRMMFDDKGSYWGEYCQDHLPISEHTKVVGHAVRAMYMYTAAAQISDDKILQALETCWENLTTRRMYITGGIGPSDSNEGFTTDFDLPNLTAYSETCAACGLIFWGAQMLAASGDSQYADVIERALYNGALSGISLNGTKYFYTNPLESRGTHQRQDFFHCACCPPNIARLIGSVQRLFASRRNDDLVIHIPARCEIQHGGGVVRVESNYPWGTQVTITVEADGEFALLVRIPDWAFDVESEWPGEEAADYEDGYAVFRRNWSSGDQIVMTFDAPPRWIEADPRVRDNNGRLALTRGPLVYCAESPDLGFAPQLMTIDPQEECHIDRRFLVSDDLPDLMEMVTIDVPCGVDAAEGDELYSAYDPEQDAPDARSATFIPYFAWANRGPSDMLVWVRKS